MNNYRIKFSDACRYTKSLGISCLSPEWKDEKYMIKEGDRRLENLIQPYMGQLKPEDASLQCINISQSMRPLIEKEYGIKTWITVGYLSVGSDYFFQVFKE